MSISVKPVLRANAGGRLRLRAQTVRLHFLDAEVTTKEHNQIRKYCLKHKISISQFLADLILEDATTAKARKTRIRINLDLKLSAKEHDKLELLVHLQKKVSIGKLIRDVLQPHLDLQRLHVPSTGKSVRFYLSEREHQTVTKHLASLGVTARKYVSFRALRAIAKSRQETQ